MIIHVIWKNEQLHKKYYLFVANLLLSDIVSTGRYGLEILLMVLYLFDIPVDRKAFSVFFIILTIPRQATCSIFVLLAIDRFISVNYPYRYRNIMTTRVACMLLVALWLITAAYVITVGFMSPLSLVRPFGIFVTTINPLLSAVFIFPMVASILVVLLTNAYLYYTTVQSNKKLQQRLKLDGDAYEISRIRRLLHNLRMQAKPTLSLLILGGIDCVINILRSVTIILITAYIPSAIISTRAYIFQVLSPLEWCRLISHSFVYGVYMKDIRMQLRKYPFYQRLQRMFTSKHGKVTVLRPE